MPLFERQLAAYMASRRWFAGKGRSFTISHVHALPWLAEAPRVRFEVVTVRFEDGSHDSYQFPMVYLDESDPDYEHALVGDLDHAELGPVVAYDAVYVKRASEVFLRAFHEGINQASMSFHVLEGASVPGSETPGTVMTAEQSNTSIAYSDVAILKLFRRVSEGFNPDIEIHAALTRRGGEHVAPLLGWIDGSWDNAAGERREGHLGMLQAFLRTATDGWDIALASVRDLLIEEDLRADEVGGDFAGEAERLGAATASIHQDLAELFPTLVATGQQVADIAKAMGARLDEALAIVPRLQDVEEVLRQSYDGMTRLDAQVTLQRIHGDLHLGQTLRTVKGWKIIDFEGEPAKLLGERLALDSPLRDVAGMLRSFDYAAGATRQDFGDGDHLRYRAEEWTQRNRSAFVKGYAQQIGYDVLEHGALIRAYEADKAVYEAVYETRNRPAWLSIPLSAIERLAAEP